ncbi:thiamine pyrophosphokinase [Tothia fuscella]|uniref:Thiamine pyrophosphokinase n=1 Tax=Tothia fuscella TaxID=1048955 RepID=A0A9P4TV98_9PEZI|nr:thiamine pyrophosphokinase [Tothia fuscella]
MTSPKLKSNLDLINECDSFPYPHKSRQLYSQHLHTYYHLRIPTHLNTTLGYLLPSVALTLSNLPDWSVDDTSTPKTVTLTTGEDESTRSAAVEKTCLAMRETGHFAVLEKWRGELYPVYGPGPGREVLFNIERSASPLFGVVSYGVHMTAYTGEEREVKIWVPRRSSTKQTYPSLLDNTVAGGIPSGESPFNALLRESLEEASLPSDLVRRLAKPAGCVTYFYIRDSRAGGETGLLQPECQYVYDLDLTEDGEGVVPTPNDDEVEGFELMGLGEVRGCLGRGEFKPNCAVVMIDFMVRHGYLNREEEGDYVEIVSRLHRFLEFPLG